MRIFVSSSFQDLHEHRAAAIRVLRQLGHEVVAMEDMVAGPSTPLNKVLEMVDRSEAYVGLFAWRYGYVPGAEATGVRKKARVLTKGEEAIPNVEGAQYGHTSITHYEYLRAKENRLPILAFLLHEQYPIAPNLVDGFDSSQIGAPTDASKIRALRDELQTAKIVSWFSTPSDVEARVAAAITLVGLSRQIDVLPAASVGAGAGDQSVLDSAGSSMVWAIAEANMRQRVVKIDLATPWWSTRLFLIAALAEKLTMIRRILVVRSVPNPRSPLAGDPSTTYIGQLSTSAVISTIEPMTPALGRFNAWMREQPSNYHDDLLTTGERYLKQGWAPAFSKSNAHAAEQRVKYDVTDDRLRYWFGDALLQQPVEIDDLQRASVVDLMRLLDYPNDFVPVLTDRVADLDEPTGRVEVIDKSALTGRLARSYLNELKERARIT